MLSESEKKTVLDIGTISEARAVLNYDLSPGSSVGYYLSMLMFNMNAGFACALFLDRKFKLIRMVKFKKDYKLTARTVSETVEYELASTKASYFLIAHNHRGKPLIPSPEDICTTNMLERKYTNECFLGHYIISDFDYILLKNNSTVHHAYNL